jgi:hypothetical protein
MRDLRNPIPEFSGRGNTAEDFVSFGFPGTANEALTAINETARDMGLLTPDDSQDDIHDGSRETSFHEPMSWLRRPVTLDIRFEPKHASTQVSVLGSSNGSGLGQLAYTRQVVAAFSSRVRSYGTTQQTPTAQAWRRRVTRWLAFGQVAPLPFVVVPIALVPFAGRRGAFLAFVVWFCAFALVPPICEAIRRRIVGLRNGQDLFLLVGCLVPAAGVVAIALLALT